MISGNSFLQPYLEARKTIHQDVQSKGLVGTTASRNGDQFTLTQDLVHEGTTFKAGSTYNVNPYAHRDAVEEKITFTKGGQTVHIEHSYDPGTFSTSEHLKVQSSGSNPFSGDFQDFDKEGTTGGIRPKGWMEKMLQADANSGYILA